MICAIKGAFSEKIHKTYITPNSIYRLKGFLWRSVFNKKKYRASQDKVFRTWTSYKILNRTTLIHLTSNISVFLFLFDIRNCYFFS